MNLSQNSFWQIIWLYLYDKWGMTDSYLFLCLLFQKSLLTFDDAHSARSRECYAVALIKASRAELVIRTIGHSFLFEVLWFHVGAIWS